MNTRLTVALLILLLALGTIVCKKSEPDVSQFEELPKDIADNLKRVPDSDVLISIAPLPVPSPTPSGPILLRACSETQSYWVQVLYPVTVCSRPELAPNTLFALAPPRNSGPVATSTVKNYKLTAFAAQRFPNPIFCQTRNGPWLAAIVRTIQCNNATSCQMAILGVPSCPACPTFIWGGENCQVNNRPTQVHFIDPVVEQGKPSFSPCNTQTNCAGSPTPAPTPIL